MLKSIIDISIIFCLFFVLAVLIARSEVEPLDAGELVSGAALMLDGSEFHSIDPVALRAGTEYELFVSGWSTTPKSSLNSWHANLDVYSGDKHELSVQGLCRNTRKLVNIPAIRGERLYATGCRSLVFQVSRLGEYQIKGNLESDQAASRPRIYLTDASLRENGGKRYLWYTHAGVFGILLFVALFAFRILMTLFFWGNISK